MFFEGLDHFFPVRGRDDMSYKGFGTQLPDADAGFARKRMLRRNHEDQLIRIDDHRGDFWILRIVGENAELAVVTPDIIGYMAAERALNDNSDRGMQPLEFSENSQKIKRSQLIGADYELSFLQFTQLAERFAGIFS